MNRILSCLLLFITLNIQAAQQESKTYNDFVNEMTTMEPKALLTWFLEVNYTKNSLILVLNNLNPQNLTAEEKESLQTIVNKLMSEKNINKILQYYIYSKKAANTSKNAKKDIEYAKELISDILHNIPPYLRSSIATLYEEIDENKTLKIIDFLKLEVEDEYKKNNFLATQINILLNKLKATSFNANFENEFKNKALLELQKECENNKINIDIKKDALVVFHLNSIAHRVASGDGSQFTSVISHDKFIIKEICEIQNYFNTTKYPYKNLAFTLPNKANRLDGKNHENLVIPAKYRYIIMILSNKGLEKFLCGNFKYFLLSDAATAQLEQAIRDNKFNIDEIKIDKDKCLKDIKVQLFHKELFITAIYKEGDLELPVKIYRNLYLFDNKFEVPATWNPLQTNLFMSEVVNIPDNSIYPTTDKKFKPNKELFMDNVGYVKVLQNVVNYNDFKCKYPNITKGYFGSKSIVPRNIILGNPGDFWAVQKNQGNQIPDDTFFVINTNFYNQQDKAYVCKNNTVPRQNFTRKQMCIAIMGYNEELSLTILEQLAKTDYNLDYNLSHLCLTNDNIDIEKVLKNLKAIFCHFGEKGLKYDMLSVQETDGSKSYYCFIPEQLYLDSLIEYNPLLLQQMP